MNYLQPFNMLVAYGAVALQILSVLVILLLVVSRDNKILDIIKRNIPAIGFMLALVATLSSLFYSNVIGFIPCSLCWWQRIFMYPLVFMFGAAWLKKDKGIGLYAWPLAIVGALISLYHNYIYYLGDGTAPCDASGVSCVQALVSEFGGYISIPSLSLTIFAAIIVLLSVDKFYKRGVQYY